MKQHSRSTSEIACLVIDDEPIAREGIMEYISRIDYLHAAGQCKSAAEAAGLLHRVPVDLIFIDIRMPELSGIEFVKALSDPPLVIFTTAYSEYALESFELDVVDYLLKPISFQRFLKAVEKAQNYLQVRGSDSGNSNGYFFVKCNGKIEKIMLEEVLYVEAMANYVIIHTINKKYITYLTFTGMEEQLPSKEFVRIHKSYLVAVSAIQTIDGSDVILGKIKLPLSKNYRNEVMKRIGPRLFKR